MRLPVPRLLSPVPGPLCKASWLLTVYSLLFAILACQSYCYVTFVPVTLLEPSLSRAMSFTGMRQNPTILLLTSPLHTKSLTVIAMAFSLRTSSPTAALDLVRHIPPILPRSLKKGTR
jgi:hypothetical protein